MTEAASRGRIVTFYSYKGGTGRSMALANVAWILASNGMRVLVIDWDLEGPGVHRYFHPFLHDKDLSNADGLIDFFLAFESAAKAPREESRPDPGWFHAYTNLLRYAISLSVDSDVFLKPGTLDFVCPGRQDAGYAIRVNRFNWHQFYEDLGGGILLEAVKERLRQEYDYILIDSRTGVSDTSGICTVQMPDDLVVCFTLNTQSMDGAATAANSAALQRTTRAGEVTLRVWPVPMRVEMAERDKLETARDLMREEFDSLLGHLSREEREDYWGRVEVLYEAFYAFEEVLSTFRDRPSQAKSMLASMEAIADYLSDYRVGRLRRISETKRAELLARYARQSSRVESHRAATLVNLSETLRLQGDMAGARNALEEAIKTLSKLLGANHLEALSAKEKLASLLLMMADYRGARTVYEDVLEVRRRINGLQHADTIACMNSLAKTLVAMGELSAARELQNEVVGLYEKVLGADHSSIVASKVESMIPLYRAMWRVSEESVGTVAPHYPGWPDSGLAVMGDFSGIQTFVFRPVPGAGGAARRLRSRSFRVSAYSELIMRWCKRTLTQGEPKVLYSAAGKFLMGLNAFEGWEATLEKMRVDLDRWAWENFGGELIFHLAAVPFEGGVVPYERLQEAITESRTKPLASALFDNGGWSAEAFFQGAAPGDGKCDACGMTRRLIADAVEDEEVCDGCIQDERIGQALPRSNYACVSPLARRDLSFLETNMELCRNQAASADGEWLAFGPDTGNASRWHLLRHLPTYAGGPLTFDEIAKSSTGARKYLGYLRIDGDGAGKHFRDLRGNPKRIWGLSRLLNVFFTETANELISKKFPYIYPVYGGGDDLFVVGPWNDLLDFSLELRLQLHALTRDLTFSAGLSLAKAREHILTHANLAGQELESAKRGPAYSRSLGRDQIRALGATIDWETFARLLPLAKDVSGWIESKQMPNSFLQQVLRLHHYWHESYTKPKSRSTTPVERYKPLLYYQIQRNLKPGKPREWAEGLLKPDSLWPWANFIARYAMLAAKRGEAED